MVFDTFSSFFNQIGHYWMPYRLCNKTSDQLPVLNRLTDIFAVGKFDYGVIVRYQNLTRKAELFRALEPGPPKARARCTPLNPLSQVLMNNVELRSEGVCLHATKNLKLPKKPKPRNNNIFLSG